MTPGTITNSGTHLSLKGDEAFAACEAFFRPAKSTRQVSWKAEWLPTPSTRQRQDRKVTPSLPRFHPATREPRMAHRQATAEAEPTTPPPPPISISEDKRINGRRRPRFDTTTPPHPACPPPMPARARTLPPTHHTKRRANESVQRSHAQSRPTGQSRPVLSYSTLLGPSPTTSAVHKQCNSRHSPVSG